MCTLLFNMQNDRNDPCPCGSGKKYKECCGNVVALDQFPQQRISAYLIAELIEYAKSKHDDVVNDGWLQFWGDFDYTSLEKDVYEMGLQNFFDWVVYDLRVDNGLTLIRDFMVYKQSLDEAGLSEEEQSILSILDNSPISLFEVESLDPDKGLFLRDLLFDGSYYVNETVAPNYLHQWDIIATRLLCLDDIYIMSGAGYIIQRYLRSEIVETFNKELEALKNHDENATMRGLLKQKGWMFNKWWLSPFDRMSDLTIVNSEGDLIVLATAIYEIDKTVDPGEVFEKFSLADDFVVDGKTCVWFSEMFKTGDKHILGSICLEGKNLKLETTSKARLDTGKSLIEKIVGASVSHKADTFQDIQKAAEDFYQNSQTGEEMSTEDARQAYEQLMNLHYEQWINDEIPVLGNKTPLEAVANNRLRSIVVEMIKDIENTEEKNRKQGRPFFNAAWIKERLGLSSEDF